VHDASHQRGRVLDIVFGVPAGPAYMRSIQVHGLRGLGRRFFTCDRHAAILDAPRSLTIDDIDEINRRRLLDPVINLCAGRGQEYSVLERVVVHQ
jgi:hypothetical protein